LPSIRRPHLLICRMSAGTFLVEAPRVDFQSVPNCSG
jgi:hypothetical protein